MLLIDIIPHGRDKRTFLQMHYAPGNLIWSSIEENLAAICLILLVFAGWHAITHARESQEQKGIPGIGQYICGNDISSIEDKKFWGNQGKRARENKVLSRTAIEWRDVH